MLRVVINDRDVNNALHRLKQVTNDMSPAFRDVGEYYLKRTDDLFRKEESPYGVPWATLSSRTIKQKRKARKIERILQSTGLFRASFSYTASPDSVEIGSNRVSASGSPIGIFHQLGSSKMASRPVLPEESRGLPPADSQEIVDIIGDYIQSAW